MGSDSRRGAFFHPLIAFNSDGVPMGLVGMQSWTRDAISHDSPEGKAQEARSDADRGKGE